MTYFERSLNNFSRPTESSWATEGSYFTYCPECFLQVAWTTCSSFPLQLLCPQWSDCWPAEAHTVWQAQSLCPGPHTTDCGPPPGTWRSPVRSVSGENKRNSHGSVYHFRITFQLPRTITWSPGFVQVFTLLLYFLARSLDFRLLFGETETYFGWACLRGKGGAVLCDMPSLRAPFRDLAPLPTTHFREYSCI